MSLTTGLIQVANSKVFCKLGNNKIRDLTQGTAYVHPATKQCNYTYTHPSTPQCNVSSRLDSIENKVNTTSGVPRWYFDKNGTWTCPVTGYYTLILVGGGGGYMSRDNFWPGATGQRINTTVNVTAGKYSVIVGLAGDCWTGGSGDATPGGNTRVTGSGLNLVALGGETQSYDGGGVGYEIGTLIGTGGVGAGGFQGAVGNVTGPENGGGASSEMYSS